MRIEMSIRTLPLITLALTTASFAVDADLQTPMGQLLEDAPAARTYMNNAGQISRLYGTTLATGQTPKETATTFLEAHSDIWNVEAANLKPIGRFPNGKHLQPIMPRRTADGLHDGYKFTGVYYSQFAGNYPVWRSNLCLLVRNSDENELVMAASDLRPIGDYQPAARMAEPSIEQATFLAKQLLGINASVDHQPQLVVFAGTAEQLEEPRLAIQFEARLGTNLEGSNYQKRLYLVDVKTGTVLYEENRVLNCMENHAAAAAASLATGSISGSVEANAGDGWSAEECDPEAQLVLPYALVNIDGSNLYADATGQFSLDGNIGENVSLSSQIRGRYFIVNNDAGADSIIETTVSDGDDVTLVHNESTSEFTFAEVDTYIAANDVREMILESNPDYPVISTQVDWPINVNLADTCNAYYDYSSINFFSSGGGCNNTGFGTITYHEYGHHMIACAGSGQNEYGEGQSDVLSLVMTFDPVLAKGFYAGNCVSGIRNADNTCLFLDSGCSTCGSAIHSCGQLISGCVYDTYLNLQAASPFAAAQLTRDLAVNSTLVHTGTSIDPSITIDYLVLDDDDTDISNGTPHYEEIAGGFNLHDMDAPQLAYLSISFPDGLPEYVDPQGGTELRVSIEDGLESYLPGTARMYVYNSIDIVPLVPDGQGDYIAVFPESECGEDIRFAIRAQSESGQYQYIPDGAPNVTYSTISAEAPPTIAFRDDCSTDPGWTISGDASDGLWERGIPAGGGNRPQTDCDLNASYAWITENTSGGGGDVDGGETIITSPQIDATGVGSVSFCYWYRNIGGGPNVQDDVFLAEASDDNGASWNTILTVGPTGAGTTGEWFTEEIFFADLPEFEPNERFRIRFIASDLNQTSRVEAAVDNIEMISIDCEPQEPGCEGDIDGNDVVDVNDVLQLLGAWGSDCDGCPSDVNQDGVLDVNDVLTLLSNFGDC